MTQVNIAIKPSAEAIQRAYGNAGISAFLAREIERVTFKIMRFAKQVTPVDTGRLRASIGGGAFKGGSFPMGTGVSVTNLEGIVSTNVAYALPVHEGTRFMRGRPFMEQGVQFAQHNLDGDIAAKLDEHLVRKLTKL